MISNIPAASETGEVTLEYAQQNLRALADRVRGGERIHVAGGISIVPTSDDDEVLRAWGRKELGRILDENRGLNADMSDDEVAELVNEEIQAVRSKKKARRTPHRQTK
jgi:hypothetical protein